MPCSASCGFNGNAEVGNIDSSEPCLQNYLIDIGCWFRSYAFGSLPAILYLLDLEPQSFHLLVNSAIFVVVAAKGYTGTLECGVGQLTLTLRRDAFE